MMNVGGVDGSGGAVGQASAEAAAAAAAARQQQAAAAAKAAAEAAAAQEAAKLRAQAGADGNSRFEAKGASVQTAKAEAGANAFTGNLGVEFSHEGQKHTAEMTALQGKLYFHGEEVGKVLEKRADGTYNVEVFGQPSGGVPAGHVAPPPAAPPQPRIAEVVSLEGGGKFTPSELTSLQSKIDTLVAVVPQSDQARVREFLQTKADVSSVDKAFKQVMDASREPGPKSLSFELQTPSYSVDYGEGGSFQQTLETLSIKSSFQVGSDYSVNGKPLPCDAEIKAGAQVAHLSDDAKRDALRQVGVGEEWLRGASPAELQQALGQVEVARSTPGTQELDLSRVSRSIGSRAEPIDHEQSTFIQEVKTSRVEGKVRFEVGPRGEINGQAPKAATGLEALAKKEGATWPNGKPEDYVKTRSEPKPGQPITQAKSLAEGTTRQGMVDTVLAVIPESSRSEVRALLEAGGKTTTVRLPSGETAVSTGVSDDALEKAYRSVLEARRSPGAKTLALDFTPSLQVERHNGDAGSEMVQVNGPPKRYTATLDVTADGKVNGALLPADLHARLSTELSRVPDEFKTRTLKEAGLSDEWLGQATPLQKEFALAKLREASMTPGTKEVDLGFEFEQTTYSGESDMRTERRAIAGKLTLQVGADGKVNGKQLTVETALATSLQMDQLPMGEKRAMMASLGFDAQAQRNVTAEQGTTLLTRAAMATQTPGEHRLEVRVGGDNYQLSLKIGDQGQIEGAGAALIPPPKKKKWYEKVLGPVLTVLSILPTPLAPFAKIASGVLNVVQGVKNKNILGVIGGALGVGGNLAGMAGNAGLASTLGNAASLANAANGVVGAVRTGDVAGLFASAISAAGAVGGLANQPISSDLANLGRAVSIGGSIARGDGVGALTGIVGMAVDRMSKPEPAAEPEAPAEATGNTGTDEVIAPAEEAAPGQEVSDEVQPIEGEDSGITGSGSAVETPLARPPITVAKGDNLTRIARSTLGDVSRLPELYAWNAAIIGQNPNAIQPGMVLELPPDDFRLDNQARSAFYASAHLPPVAPKPIATANPSSPEVPSGLPSGRLQAFSEDLSELTTQLQAATHPEERSSILDTLKSVKLKFELGLGIKKFEVSIGKDGINVAGRAGVSLETKGRLGPLKFTAEPNISVDKDGIRVSGTVQGSAGPVSVSLKGSYGTDGQLKIDPLDVGLAKEIFGVGGSVFGVGANVGVEFTPGGSKS